jgi:L-amino acid N-acyltransferase YncA
MAWTIRFAAETDATQILDIYAPIVTDTAISFEEEPPTRREMAGRIRSTLERYPWLACEEAGHVVGYVYAGGFRSRPAYQWAVEITAYVRPEAQRRGVVSALYAPLLGILRRQGFINALAGIALPNDAGVGLHERFGFKPVGVLQDVGFKLMRWHDVEWWALRLQQPRDPPDAPKPLPEVWAASADLMETRQ